MSIRNFKKSKFIHFSLLVIIVGFLYSNTLNLGFFSDDFLGIARYNKMGLGGLSNNYDNPFYMPFSFIFQALELSFFKSYLAIKIINLLLFLSTSFLLYMITTRILVISGNPKNKVSTTLIVTLLFLCSPYQTEAVNWFSSQAYLLSTFFAMLALHQLIKDTLKTNTAFYLYLLFFFFALLNKEISLILPFIAFFLRSLQSNNQKVNLRLFILGNLIVLLVYFTLRYLYLGAFIGGYGIEAHTNLSPQILTYGIIAYLAKFFLYYRYLPQELRLAIPIIIFLISFVIAILHYTRFGALTKNRGKLILVLLSIFIISLLPVLNLETSFLGNIQSDRYGYFPSIFFALFIGASLRPIWPKLFFLTGITIVGLSSYLTIQTNTHWVEAKNIRDVFLSEITQLDDQKELILINLPDNYEGVYLFRHGFEQCINESLFNNLSIAYNHAITDNQQFKLKGSDSETNIEINEVLTQHHERIPGISFLRQNRKTLMSIKHNDVPCGAIYFFDKVKLIKLKPSQQ